MSRLLVIISLLMALDPVQALAKGQPTVFDADAVPAVVNRALPNISADELIVVVRCTPDVGSFQFFGMDREARGR